MHAKESKCRQTLRRPRKVVTRRYIGPPARRPWRLHRDAKADRSGRPGRARRPRGASAKAAGPPATPAKAPPSEVEDGAVGEWVGQTTTAPRRHSSVSMAPGA